MPDKAVFLDRDDTLINDPGYISDPTQVELLPGASKALIDIKKMGYKTVIVSNQSAVARGIVTENTLTHIHARLRELLGRQNAYLDAIYYCPFHPEGSVAKYRKESECRKPNPGMLLKAAQEMDIDLEQSWMVGDSYRDIAAGKKAGCQTILINSSAHPAKKLQDDPEPDHKAVNIVEAVNIIKMANRQLHISVEAAKENKESNKTFQSPPEPDNMVKGHTDVVEKIAHEKHQRDTDIEEALSASQQFQDKKNEDDTDMQTPIQEAADQIDEINDLAQKTIKNTTQQDEAPRVPRKAKTFKPKQNLDNTQNTKSDSKTTIHSASDSDTYQLLQDIHATLKKMQRQALFTEFSLFRLLAWSMQIVATGLLILSLVFLLDVEKDITGVFITMSYAAITQLMVIAFCLISNRK